MSNLGLPKHCDICKKPCGGRDMPAAWAMYDEEDGHWLCERHYRKWEEEQEKLSTPPLLEEDPDLIILK